MPGRHTRDQPLHSAGEQIRHVIRPLLALAYDGATPWYPSVFGRGISRQEHARGVWLVGSERFYAQGMPRVMKILSDSEFLLDPPEPAFFRGDDSVAWNASTARPR